MPDARLVSRIRLGDERAFEAVYDRYHRQLLAFCRHMLGNREEAEDAVQHAFVSAHHALRAGDDRVVELRPWLYAIARNRCLSMLRARRESVALEDVPEPSTDGLAVAHEVEQREDLQGVLADLARLPDEQRAALVLAELGDLSHDEVADVLGVRRDKVKALVFQARESLASWRQARDADCRIIREQLATLSGGALRRGPLRKHLDVCDDCRTFRSEVRRQREAMALLLPVIPSLALKAKVIGAVAAGGPLLPVAGAGIGAAGVTAGTGAAGAGSGLAILGGGIAGKALVVAAVAGTAGGGYAMVRDQTAPAPKPAVRIVTPPASPASPTAPATPQSAFPGTTSRAPGRGGAASGNGREARAVPGLGDEKRSDRSGGPRQDRGRPALPGARGRERAPNARGFERRPASPPGQARPRPERGSSGAAARDEAPGRIRREQMPAADRSAPDKPVKVKPARPAATLAPAGEADAGTVEGTRAAGQGRGGELLGDLTAAE